MIFLFLKEKKEKAIKIVFGPQRPNVFTIWSFTGKGLNV